jgi:hypothetical protein
MPKQNTWAIWMKNYIEKSLESTADVLKVGVLKVHKAAIRCISVDSSSTHVAAGCEEGSVCKKLQVN